jgi:TRAP-type mannitol/chloroaromatic compound transport system substrate-binding protein
MNQLSCRGKSIKSSKGNVTKSENGRKEMKRKTLLVVVMGVIVVSFIAGAMPTPVPAQPKVIHWRGQNAFPGGISAGYANNMADWLKRISDGQLVVDVGAPGSIVPVPETFDAISKGLLDYAYTCSSFSMGKFPEQEILSTLPMAYTTLGECWDFMFNRGAFQIFQEVYAEKNVKWFPNFPNTIVEVGASFDLKSIRDIKGKKLRAAGSIADVIKLLGGSPVYLPPGEIYMAIKLGTIDGYVGGIDYLEDLKLKEVVKYFVKEPNLSSVLCEHIINMNSWNKLPAALREKIQREQRHAELDWTMHATVEIPYLERRVSKDYGVKFVSLPEDDHEEIMKAAMVVWDRIAAKSPRCAKLINILKTMARELGKIK